MTATTVPGLTTVHGPADCPWGGRKCAECGHGRFFATNLRRHTRQEYDASQCVQPAVHLADGLLASGLTPEQQRQTFAAAVLDRFNRAVYGELQRWTGTGRGWYLYGPPSADNPGGNGTGKSYALCALTVQLCRAGVGAVFTTAADFLEQQRAEMQDNRDEMRRYCTVPVLCLDDLGNEHIASDWARERLYRLINTRVNAGLPIVVSSTKLLPDGVRAHIGGDFGNAIASRLDAACELRVLTGPDRRRQ